MSTVDTLAHEVVVAQTPEERQQCLDVRTQVFHVEQKFPLETEIDENEEISTHFLLRLVPSLTPIGTIRAFKSAHGDYKLTRLAVLKDYRKYRFGRLLVESLHGWVQTHASETNTTGAAFAKVVCHSQLPVQAFYARFGYAPEGEQFDEDGDPHQKMVLRLPL
ncbi:acyl-CoA N-acyltransferase [Ephemerocybe angulata]|uniref:Acyl-CoA N-acyltransferase n=1 Tax=Ephemerocybe angulata TaxID=980116 RepID=A0A8H6IB13_9AGAR|nr:acyl-CoA N-acyltransferase [Tulosesus angulatus]